MAKKKNPLEDIEVKVILPPGAELDKDQKAEEERKARTAIDYVLVKMLLARGADCPFFAHVGMNLEFGVHWGLPTAGTDGRSIMYNPSFINNELKGYNEHRTVIAHEILHVVLKHFARRGPRNKTKWNIAGDLEINWMLKEAGFVMPSSACVPGEGPFANIAPNQIAEAYYEQLPQSMESEVFIDFGGMGGVDDAGDYKEQQALGRHIENVVARARDTAKQAGEFSAGLKQAVEAASEHKVPWYEVLQDYTMKHARNDYSMRRPSRRYLCRNMYLPSLSGEEMGDIVFVLDGSGSCCNPKLFGRYQAECAYICEQFHCRAHIYYHDTEVTHVQYWNPGDPPLQLQVYGGGGTSHVPVFDRVINKDKLEPVVMICLTDMETCFPKDEPGFPVIWVNIGRKDAGGPGWGKTIWVDHNDY